MPYLTGGCLNLQLRYRRGSEATAGWLVSGLEQLPLDLIMDAELVVFEEGRAVFNHVQHRFGPVRPDDVRRAARVTLQPYSPSTWSGWGSRPSTLPLLLRKAAFAEVLTRPQADIRYVEHVDTAGDELYRRAREFGGEVVMAKRRDSAYRPGRSRDWIKARQNPT